MTPISAREADRDEADGGRAGAGGDPGSRRADDGGRGGAGRRRTRGRSPDRRDSLGRQPGRGHGDAQQRRVPVTVLAVVGTKIEWNGRRVTLVGLRLGDRAQARYNPAYSVASQIESVGPWPGRSGRGGEDDSSPAFVTRCISG